MKKFNDILIIYISKILCASKIIYFYLKKNVCLKYRLLQYAGEPFRRHFGFKTVFYLMRWRI